MNKIPIKPPLHPSKAQQNRQGYAQNLRNKDQADFGLKDPKKERIRLENPLINNNSFLNEHKLYQKEGLSSKKNSTFRYYLTR